MSPLLTRLGRKRRLAAGARAARFITSSLCGGLFASVAAAQAASAGGATIVVTGTRTPTRIDQALAETTVVDREQVERAAGRTLPELLAQLPGVQFWSTGAAGQVGSVSLRGLETRHVLLLVDGVRYGSATIGSPTWETLPLQAIDRIEIVRGPLSGLYGSDAVGGVIQIFTRRGTPGLQLHGSATAGSHRTGQVAGGLRFGNGEVDGALHLAHADTRGISATNANVPFGSHDPDRDGFEQGSAAAQLGWRFAAGWRADLNVLASDGEAQFDDGPGVDSRQGQRARVLGVQAAGALRPGWRTVLRLARSTDESETRASASPFSTLGTIASRQRQLSWENTLATPLGTALLLAERLHQEVSRPDAPFAVSARTIDALAAGLNGSTGLHHWQASVRHDRNSQFGRQTTGSAAYGLELAAGLRAGAAWGTSFVAPSFNQLYFPDFGNPALLPEEGTHRELSLRWQAAGVTSRLAYFDNRIRGYISSGPLPANIPRTRIDGVSFSVDAMLGAWTLAASIDSLNPVNDTAGSANAGRILPRRVQDSARLAADWSAGAWKLGGTFAAFGERFDDAANSRRLGGYATLDLRADWQLARQWALGLRLNNVGDKTYETVYGYNQSGREGFVTLRYQGL